MFDSKGKELDQNKLYKSVGFSLSLNDTFLGYYEFPKRIGSYDKKLFIDKVKSDLRRNKYYEERRKLERALARDFKKLEKLVIEEEKLRDENKLKENEFLITHNDSISHRKFFSMREGREVLGLSMYRIYTPVIDLFENLKFIKKEIKGFIEKMEQEYAKRYHDNMYSNAIAFKIFVPRASSTNVFDKVSSTPLIRHSNKRSFVEMIFRMIKRLNYRETRQQNYVLFYKGENVNFAGMEIEVSW